MHRRWPNIIKERAKTLRAKGYSYGVLTHELKVSKSTLHQWIRGVKRPKKFSMLDRIRWIKEIQPLGAQANKRKREYFIKSLKDEIDNELKTVSLDIKIKKVILSMLYWAEGSKGAHEMVTFANTDPRMILLFITLFRQCYTIDESKLRIRLHLHYYHNEKDVKNYWSKLLHIPLTQFTKTYRKTRSKEKTFRRNFGGICFLKYNSVRQKDIILEFAYLFGEKIIGKIKVPVA